MKARQWFRVQNVADDPTVAEIHIIDFIGDWIDDYFGFGVTAKSFIDQLAALPPAVKSIRVHINSPGGDVFSALTIANALRDQQATKGRAVDTIVDGIAASAASIVMMAGGKIQIADNGIVMIHNPMTYAAGNAADLRKAADTMDTLRNTIVATYKWNSSMESDAIAALMDAETWMDADEAVTNGFATEKISGVKATATLDRRATSKLAVPEKFKARVEALVKQPEPAKPEPVAAAADEVLAAVDAAGLGTAFARELIKAALPMDQVTAKITTAKNERVQREARATAIRTLCTAAKQPELADGYVNGGMSEADVRAHLTVITAKQDKVEIDTRLAPDGKVADKGVNLKEIYGKLNKPLEKR